MDKATAQQKRAAAAILAKISEDALKKLKAKQS
jgi:hypothetical protein